MQQVRVWLGGQWTQLSTKIGSVCTVLSTATLAFAPYNHDMAWVGLAAGIGLILFQQQKPSA